jgi:3-oxoacyl-[acyl-carrier-protein] synthase II
MSKKIVVTGIGATSPLAGNAPDSWKALLNKESGARNLEQEWVAKWDIPITFAAHAAVQPENVLERIETKRLDPSSQFALIAGREAWLDAGSPEVNPERLAIDWSTGIAKGSETTKLPSATR